MSLRTVARRARAELGAFLDRLDEHPCDEWFRRMRERADRVTDYEYVTCPKSLRELVDEVERGASRFRPGRR